MASTFKRKTSFALKTGLLDNKSTHVDTRPILVKFSDYLPILFPFLFIFTGILALLIPTISYFLLVGSSVAVLYAVSIQFNYLLSAPTFSKKNGAFQEKKGDGLTLIGYDLLFNRQLWLDLDRETRMLLISGTTGSGKTVTANSMIYQASLQGHFKGGAPILICDGKGSIKGLYEFLFYIIRAGRLHDVRILNFLLGGNKIEGDSLLDDLYPSNRSNPFSFLNAEESRGLVLSFGRSSEGGNNDFFKDRASTMLGGLFPPLMYRRDMLGQYLDVTGIQQALDLRVMFEISKDEDIPLKYRKGLQEYLKTLKGFSDSSFETDDMTFDNTAEDQHTYNTSMLSKTINEMSESLSHIFCNVGSEVNLRTGFQVGHITIVMLPTIEREPDGMAELGRMTIGSLRPALSPLLGYKVQGTYNETVKSLPSNRRIPIRIYCDEILNYYVKGISNFLSLLRSSNVSMILMGQSLKGIEDAGISEGRQSLANLNNKLMFGNQDVYETMDLVEKSIGKAKITRISEMNSKEWGGWKNSDRLQMSEESVVNSRDMAGADPMEGLYLYRGDIIPFKSSTFFINKGDELSSFKLNLLAGIESPTIDDVNNVKAQLSFQSNLDKGELTDIVPPNENVVIDDFVNDFNKNLLAAKSISGYSNEIDILTYTLVNDLLNNDDEDYNYLITQIESESIKKEKDTNTSISTESGVTVVKESITLDFGDDSFSEKQTDLKKEDKVEKHPSEVIAELKMEEINSDLDKGTESNFIKSSNSIGVFDVTGVVPLLDDDIDEVLESDLNNDNNVDEYNFNPNHSPSKYDDDEYYKTFDVELPPITPEPTKTVKSTRKMSSLLMTSDQYNSLNKQETEADSTADTDSESDSNNSTQNSSSSDSANSLSNHEITIKSHLDKAGETLNMNFSSLVEEMMPKSYPVGETPPIKDESFQSDTVKALDDDIDNLINSMDVK